MKTTIDEYEKQANDFLIKCGAEIKIIYLKNGKHFDNDEDTRDIYHVIITRGTRSFSFNFGQSVMKSQYYQDVIKKGCTYTMNGGCRTGRYKINDIIKYNDGGMKLKLIKGTEPTTYDVLSCLTKYDPGTFESFCAEYGYDTDSKRAEKIYQAVKDEYKNVAMLFNSQEVEELAEIQ